MGRGIEQVAVRLERGLGAVAVMDIEIHHGDAAEPVFLAGIKRTDGDVVEQAEAHGPARLGMMARRSHRAEGVVDLAGHDRIDGVANRARGP